MGGWTERLWALALAVLLSLGLSAVARAQSTPAPSGAATAKSSLPRVLVLHSYHVGRATTQSAIRAVAREFGGEVELVQEFLGARRQAPRAASEHLHRVLEAGVKRDGPPTLIITFDDNALTFALRRHADLFQNAPLVFAGVNSRSRAISVAEQPNITGLHERLAVGPTIDLAMKLHPVPLRRVVALTNQTPSSRVNFRKLAAAAAERGVQVERLELDAITFAEARERLSADTRADTAYLFLGAFRDSTGVALDAAGVFAWLAPAAGRPIYDLIDRGRPIGAAGGDLFSYQEHARRAAEIAKDVLAGRSIDEIPPVLGGRNGAMVDAAVARRYGLTLKALDGAVTIQNREPSFSERNRAAIGVGMGVLTAMLGVLGFIQLSNVRVRIGLQQLNAALEQRNSELLEAQAHNKHQSMHDMLTGLPNRRFIEQRFRELSERARDDGDEAPGVWALLHIDLDRFKQINDTLGHAAGDHVLITVAGKLRHNAPKSGFVARVGGDEFLALGHFGGIEEVEAYARRLVAELRRPVPFESHLCRFGASVGVATLSNGADGLIDLFRNADVALYRAKADGRGRHAFFSAKDQAQILANKALADDLARGFEADELAPYFQPQICARSGRVIGVEALVRWIHPIRGVLAPGEFLSAAAGVGLLSEIDRVVLRKTHEHVRQWRARGLTLRQVSVNVSNRRLSEPSLLGAVDELDFGETKLCFELLESIFFDSEDDPALRTVDLLRRRGVMIEIDDFGTGHASIVSLLRIKPDKLKIARELIQEIEGSDEGLNLVRAIVEMGRSLGIKIVAEGAETEEQMRLLRALDCDVIQGYAVSKPLPPDAVPEFVWRTLDHLDDRPAAAPRVAIGS